MTEQKRTQTDITLTKENIEYYISEDRRSVWGVVINKALEKMDSEYRFQSISLTKLGPIVAQGIWTIPQTEKVIEKTEGLKVPSEDYLNNEGIGEGCKSFGFSCDIYIIKKLIEEGIFISSSDGKSYRLPTPWTQEANPPIVEVFLSSDRVRGADGKGFVQFLIK